MTSTLLSWKRISWRRGYVKSISASEKRPKEVNLKNPEELFVFMTLLGHFKSFATQRRSLESLNNLFMEIIRRGLRQEASRFKIEQVQQPQGQPQNLDGTTCFFPLILETTRNWWPLESAHLSYLKSQPRLSSHCSERQPHFCSRSKLLKTYSSWIYACNLSPDALSFFFLMVT